VHPFSVDAINAIPGVNLGQSAAHVALMGAAPPKPKSLFRNKIFVNSSSLCSMREKMLRHG